MVECDIFAYANDDILDDVVGMAGFGFFWDRLESVRSSSESGMIGSRSILPSNFTRDWSVSDQVDVTPFTYLPRDLTASNRLVNVLIIHSSAVTV